MSAGVFLIWLAKINVKKKSALCAFSIFWKARRQVQAFLKSGWKEFHIHKFNSNPGVFIKVH
jgi:hypothetical protein